MKKLINFVFLLLLISFAAGCKSPSETSSSEVTIDEAAVDTETATDAEGNTTTTSTAADGTITTTITSADGTSVTTVALPAEVNNTGSAGGVWRGVFTADADGKTTFYKAFITPSRQMVMLSDSEASFVVQGSDMLQSTSFVQTSDGITINLKEYVKENDVAAVDVEITANLTPTDNIRGTYVRGTETGTVLFIYDPVYERGVGDEARVAFYYTNTSTWTISKALESGERYRAFYYVDESFKLTSRKSGALPFVEVAAAEEAAIAAELIVIEAAADVASLAIEAESAAAAADLAAFEIVADSAANFTRAAADAARNAADNAKVAANFFELESDRDNALIAAEAAGVLALTAVDSARDSATTSAGASVTAAAAARAAPDDEGLAGIAEARKAAAEAAAAAAAAARSVADAAAVVVTAANLASAAADVVDAARSDAGATGNNIAADTEGCIYSGNLDIIDTHYFIYNVTFEVSGCDDLKGTYNGLATLEEEFSIADHPHTHYRFMTFGVSDGEGRTINNRMTLSVFGI